MENATATDRLDLWMERYERTAPEAPDYEPDWLPVHPDPDQRGCIAMVHPASELNRLRLTLPAPSYTLASGAQCQSVWWLDWPVMNTAETSRQWNTWAHVAHCLAYHLRGRLLVDQELANPAWLCTDQLPVSQEGYYLVALREALIDRKLWTKASTIPPGMQSRGGQAGTEAQQEARRANLAKANAASQQSQMLIAATCRVHAKATPSC